MPERKSTPLKDLDDRLPYRLRETFLSTPELALLRLLQKMARGHYVICPKVALNDLFYIVRPNENVHFSSVLVLHRASQTIHVDDTLMYSRLPLPMRMLGFPDILLFHPTLWLALEKRKGAGRDFRDWAENLAERWRDAANMCAAHTAVLTAAGNRGASIHDRILTALDRVSVLLR